MTRLIDADLYKEDMTHEFPEYYEEVLDAQPTIDAVPVIRCKDCVSWRKSYFESVDGMVCNKTRYIMKPDDYCSMAKRKEE